MLKEAIELSEAERQFRLEQALQRQRVTNSDIWLSVIAAVSTSRQETFLRFSEAAQIIDTQCSVHKNGNISVAEIVDIAGIAGLSKNRFLQKVTFNFDYEPKPEARLQEAKAVGRQISPYSQEFQSLEEYTEEEFRHVTYANWLARRRKIFNQATQSPEVVYELSGKNPSDRERIHSKILNVLEIMTLPFGLVGLGVAFRHAFSEFGEKTGGWRDEDRLRTSFYAEVLHLVRDDELIKPKYSRSRTMNVYGDLVVVKRSSIN